MDCNRIAPVFFDSRYLIAVHRSMVSGPRSWERRGCSTTPRVVICNESSWGLCSITKVITVVLILQAPLLRLVLVWRTETFSFGRSLLTWMWWDFRSDPTLRPPELCLSRGSRAMRRPTALLLAMGHTEVVAACQPYGSRWCTTWGWASETSIRWLL